jgi:hypothetical protein
LILYHCPERKSKSAGIRIIYRHVEILLKHGYQVAVLHQTPGFKYSDMPEVPIRYANQPVNRRDILVVPEGLPPVMAETAELGLRLFVIALSWSYVYPTLPDGTDWRAYNVERVLTHSPIIADFIAWAMRLPVHVFQWGINPQLYYYLPQEKTRQLTYISRKAVGMQELMRVLRSREERFIDQLTWKGLADLAEADYAREVRRSAVFLNMSSAEGLCCSVLEAMRSGTLIAGFNSVGGKRELIGDGHGQNCILAENLDYITLAYKLEPLLIDLLADNPSRWERIRDNALATAAPYTPEAEEQSVLAIWKNINL